MPSDYERYLKEAQEMLIEIDDYLSFEGNGESLMPGSPLHKDLRKTLRRVTGILGTQGMGLE